MLDEPTVGVDPQSRNHIFETIRRLNEEDGTTILYTSHYIEEVQSLCDRVGILDGGKLIALDAVDQLIADHGSKLLEVEVRGDLDVTAASAALGVQGSAEGQTMRFEPTTSIGAAIGCLEAAGLEVTAVDSGASNLEGVFLKLTGHRLRDEA